MTNCARGNSLVLNFIHIDVDIVTMRVSADHVELVMFPGSLGERAGAVCLAVVTAAKLARGAVLGYRVTGASRGTGGL